MLNEEANHGTAVCMCGLCAPLPGHPQPTPSPNATLTPAVSLASHLLVHWGRPDAHTIPTLQGPEAKLVLDAVVDKCADMQNLREGIFSYRSRFLKEAREKQRNTILNVCLVRMREGRSEGRVGCCFS